MSRLAKTLTFISVLSMLTLAVFPAAAQLEKIKDQEAQELKIAAGQDAGALRKIVFNIINVGLSLIALAAGIYIIISGVRYITSQGDEGATEKAKKGIMYALIGLIVIGLAAVLVNFVLDAIGGGRGGGNQGANQPAAGGAAGQPGR